MSNPETLAANKSFLLLHFSYGDSSVWRLTNANQDLDTKLGTYLNDPKIKVKLPPNSIAGLGKAEVSVDISETPWLFASDISSGRAFPPLTLTIYQRTNDYIRTLSIGRVTRAVRNPQGREGIVRLFVAGAKNDLDQSGGFTCNNTCNWRFGESKTCKKDVIALEETGTLTIQDLSSPKVTIAGLAAHPNRYWRRGKVKLDGLTLRIRNWTNGTDFYLAKLPPVTWDGATVTVTPGCNKLFTTCIFWNNLKNFSGIGLKALEYNPLIENINQ